MKKHLAVCFRRKKKIIFFQPCFWWIKIVYGCPSLFCLCCKRVFKKQKQNSLQTKHFRENLAFFFWKKNEKKKIGTSFFSQSKYIYINPMLCRFKKINKYYLHMWNTWIKLNIIISLYIKFKKKKSTTYYSSLYFVYSMLLIVIFSFFLFLFLTQQNNFFFIQNFYSWLNYLALTLIILITLYFFSP